MFIRKHTNSLSCRLILNLLYLILCPTLSLAMQKPEITDSNQEQKTGSTDTLSDGNNENLTNNVNTHELVRVSLPLSPLSPTRLWKVDLPFPYHPVKVDEKFK